MGIEFLVHVEGEAFQEDASLAESLEILSNYSAGFSYCLNRGVQELREKQADIPAPILRLKGARSGSLDVDTVVDCVAGIIPVAHEVVEYGWTVYKSAADLISTATKFFKMNGKPMQIHLDESPNASAVNVMGNNNVIYVTPPVYEAAQAIHKNFDKMAAQITNHKATLISVKAIEDDGEILGELEINRDNHTSFSVPFQDITDDEPIKITCNIYRINRRTLKGALEVQEEEGVRSLSFIIEKGDINDYVDAMKATSSTVTAYREMSVNALGERTITRLHLISIVNNHFND